LYFNRLSLGDAKQNQMQVGGAVSVAVVQSAYSYELRKEQEEDK